MVNQAIWIGITVGVFFAGIGISYAIFESTYDPISMKFRSQELFDQMMSNNPKMSAQWMSPTMHDQQRIEQMQSWMQNSESRNQMMNYMMNNPEFMNQWMSSPQHAEQMANIMRDNHNFTMNMFSEMMNDPSLRLQMMGHMTDDPEVWAQMQEMMGSSMGPGMMGQMMKP